MSLPYKPAAIDYLMSGEQEASLLANAAHKVWQRWCLHSNERDDDGERKPMHQGRDPVFDDLMRAMYQYVREIDVFYSGFREGKAAAPEEQTK